MRRPSSFACVIALILALFRGEADALESQFTIATKVCQDILGAASCSSVETVSLWMTIEPFGDDHVVRDRDLTVSDVAFPTSASLNWLVVIDDNPFGNFGHPVRWLFVSDDPSPTYSSIHTSKFPPTVWGNFGAGSEEPVGCTDHTSGGCAPSTSAPEPPSVAGTDENCLHAVLISGGIRNGICSAPVASKGNPCKTNDDCNTAPGNGRCAGVMNHDRYGKNLRSMYSNLREAGYPAANVTTYYDNGEQLDLDNADADDDDTTGNDVSGNVAKNNFRSDIQNYCQNLDPTKDVLVIYTSNHGTEGKGLNLWDWNADGKTDADELYTPAELAADTKDCKVCHLFIIMDQCHSGDFTALATDGDHANTSVYTAAKSTEESVCRLYMNYWEDIDLTTTTVDAMHASVTTSMAGVQKICTATIANPMPSDFCELCTQNADCVSNSCRAIGKCSTTTTRFCFADGDCPATESCTIPDSANSTPQKAEGTANNGNVTLDSCCPTPTPTATPVVTPTATPAPLRHFECYEEPRAAFPPLTVSLADSFGPSTVDVIRRNRICNPADKNGEDPSAPFDPNHLTGYTIKQTAPLFRPIVDITVINQFGTVVVDLAKPDYMLVPASKSQVAPPGPLVNPAVDHYKCYKVRKAKTRVSGIALTDQFGSLLFDVKKPIRYCVAADKNGEGIRDRSAALMCYKGRQSSLPRFRGIEPIYIEDQFGAATTSVDHLRELCVPSPRCFDPTPRFRCTIGNRNAGDPCLGRGPGGGCDAAVVGDNAGTCVGGPVCAAGNLNVGSPCGPIGPGGGCDAAAAGDNLGQCTPYTFHADLHRPAEGGWSTTNTVQADCLATRVGACAAVDRNAGAACAPIGPGGGCDALAAGDNLGTCRPGSCAAGDRNAGAPCGPRGPGGGCDLVAAGDNLGTCEAVRITTAGTLGAIVFDAGNDPFILSNNHVLARKSDRDTLTRDFSCRNIAEANSPNEPSEPAMQPGTLDGGVSGNPGGPHDIAVLLPATGLAAPPALDPYEPLCMRGRNCPGAAVCVGGLDSGNDCAPAGIGGGCDAVVAGDNLGLCMAYSINLCNQTGCVDAVDNTKNCIDASIARLFTAIPGAASVLDVGANATFGALAGPLSCKAAHRMAVEAALVGQIVVKSGRSSGFTCGRISGFTNPNVGYPDNLGMATGRGVGEFVNQLVIKSLGQKFCQGAGNDCEVCARDTDCPNPARNACIRAFSCPGDSGSVVFLENGQPVGLLFSGGPSGGEDLTFANPIHPVADRFGIHF